MLWTRVTRAPSGCGAAGMDTRVCALALALLTAAGLLVEAGVCQPVYVLRPAPSDSLPLLVLREDPDPMLDPRERDLNETELRAILGGDFDARFLSVAPPAEDKNLAGNDDLEELDFQRLMPKEIRAVDFELPLGRRQKPSRKLKRRLQQWLWAYSLCPVAHAWTDLGSRFWPRFVRVGTCPSKRSCSVPEGMVCKPAGSTYVSTLRWRCVRKAGLKCEWIRVQYPLITDCKCACAS